MRMTDTKLLTPREVAGYLGLQPRTITRWCREGKIGGVKVGRVWRIAPDDQKLHLMVNKRWSDL